MKYCPKCKEELERRLVDGVERLACPSSPCGFVHWENPTPVVAGLIQYGDKYVLARNAQWPPGMFSLITGFLEKGESPEEAVLREVKEELGVIGNQVIFLGHYLLPEFNQLIMAFSVQACGDINLGEEIAEVKLLSRSEIERIGFGWLEVTAKIVARSLQLPIPRSKDAPQARSLLN